MKNSERRLFYNNSILSFVHQKSLNLRICLVDLPNLPVYCSVNLYKTAISSFTSTDVIIPCTISNRKNTQGLATYSSFNSNVCVKCDFLCISICALHQLNLYSITGSVCNMCVMVSFKEKNIKKDVKSLQCGQNYSFFLHIYMTRVSSNRLFLQLLFCQILGSSMNNETMSKYAFGTV